MLMNGLVECELLTATLRSSHRIFVVPGIEVRDAVNGVKSSILVHHMIGYGRVRSLHQRADTVVVTHAIVQIVVARRMDEQ